ncbi:MAG: hypothetical protein A3J38_06105 [Gammaproteobacteria bacterium RIFCSPHIGHO2_12_FULL_45_9]|nr:MAG: hypothetical protein A3J38_06105 [Gammaproteobacteria bacterium RIFCSPHIGHO2_12_FULL_45_9]
MTHDKTPATKTPAMSPHSSAKGSPVDKKPRAFSPQTKRITSARSLWSPTKPQGKFRIPAIHSEKNTLWELETLQVWAQNHLKGKGNTVLVECLDHTGKKTRECYIELDETNQVNFKPAVDMQGKLRLLRWSTPHATTEKPAPLNTSFSPTRQ